MRAGAGAVPADLPVDEHRSLTEAWRRWYGLWDALFALVFAGVGWLLATQTPGTVERVGALSALGCAALAYLVVGRRLILRDRLGRDSWLFGGFILAAYVVAVALTPDAGFVLFAILPMLYMSIPTVAASLATAVAILLPVFSTLLGSRLSADELRTTLMQSGFMVLFAIFAGFWLNRVAAQSQQRKELIDQLAASRAEVSRLSHESGVAAERERLAAEIHDTLAQGFASIVTLAQAAESAVEVDSTRVRERLGLLADTARENLAESRALVAALTPQVLAEHQVAAALRRQLDALGTELGIPVVAELGDTQYELATNTEVVLLRAGQEALSNIRKHARPSTVQLRLTHTESTVLLSVADDGAGFDADRPSAGYGLPGIRARVAQIGGQLRVHSSPGQGTELEVEVPR
ncbi:signal transduction histidine kinase [Tamaricihabitans halophyticus]|uniref:Oxygen sensor histidine kinase NreB n=1 Tax=Tamaricihabitans halophyticus TaxID=1262583 RepID=A0A4R2R3D6_9PSEU|nr:signal transduction histidine kinase [Tamaricihabitans halophyticus]